LSLCDLRHIFYGICTIKDLGHYVHVSLAHMRYGRLTIIPKAGNYERCLPRCRH